MKILVVVTYPICNPRHGGQVRVHNLVTFYRSSGHSVQVIGVLGSDAYPSESGFVSYPGQSIRGICRNTFLVEDYCIGRLFSESEPHFWELANQVSERPDFIQVEHPWLFRFAKRLASEVYDGVPIVYSSHNVEFLLKRQILENYRTDDEAESVVSEIEAMEREAVRDSVAVVSVSASDAAWMHENEPDCQVFIAANGVSERPLAADHSVLVERFLGGRRQYALYCASGHPPNVEGFFAIFDDGFGSLKPDECLIIAGAAGEAIASNERVFKSAKLAERTTIAGVVEESTLAALIYHAHCIILPLTQGGGTNLKTAEALLSGKHVVATPIAMRGFESFLAAPGVHVREGAPAFKRKLRDVMAMPPVELTEDQVAARRKLLWAECLRPLVDMLDLVERGGV